MVFTVATDLLVTDGTVPAFIDATKDTENTNGVTLTFENGTLSKISNVDPGVVISVIASEGSTDTTVYNMSQLGLIYSDTTTNYYYLLKGTDKNTASNSTDGGIVYSSLVSKGYDSYLLESTSSVITLSSETTYLAGSTTYLVDAFDSSASVIYATVERSDTSVYSVGDNDGSASTTAIYSINVQGVDATFAGVFSSTKIISATDGATTATFTVVDDDTAGFTVYGNRSYSRCFNSQAYRRHT